MVSHMGLMFLVSEKHQRRQSVMTTHTQQNSPHLLGYTESLGGGVPRFPAEQQLRRDLGLVRKDPRDCSSQRLGLGLHLSLWLSAFQRF